MTSSRTCTKAALNLLGHDVGGMRLPSSRSPIEQAVYERCSSDIMLA